jgi:hypothetical protein
MLVEDTINEVSADQKKKMSKANSQSYNKLKQRFKKYLAAQGEDEMTYEKQLLRYREKPQEEKKPEVEEEPEEEEEDEQAEEEEEKEEEASEEDSESDEEIKAERKAAKAEAKKEAAKAKAAEAEEEGEEYYDEEYDAEEAASESEGKVEIDTEEIDPKIRTKFSFLFKERDEMIPEERRWTWVKKEALPEDLCELMEKLSRKKGKKVKAAPTEAQKDKKGAEDGAADINASEFVTTVRTRNDLLVDYTIIHNVRERLEILT